MPLRGSPSVPPFRFLLWGPSQPSLGLAPRWWLAWARGPGIQLSRGHAVTVAPLSGASSGERGRPGPVWVEAVEFPHRLYSVLQVLEGLPGGGIVASPLDQILQASVVQPAVKDSLHLPLLLPIYNDGWGWR